MTPAIKKYNGFIDKYIGDAVMALFPTSAEAVSYTHLTLPTKQAV